MPPDLIILAGESNMAGRGELGGGDPAPDPRVRVLLQPEGGIKMDPPARATRPMLETAADPLHADKPEKAGVGLGLSFAHQLI